MPTIIDALVVTLRLDASKFKRGQAETDEALKKTKDNTVKHAKEIEAKAKMATEGFRQMRNQVLSLVGAFVSASGLKSFVERITTSDAALGRLAETLDMSTERLSAWRGLAEKMGGSAGDIEAAFRLINDTVQKMRLGRADPGQVSALGMLLGDSGLEQFVSTATTVEQKMQMIQRAVAGYGDKPLAMRLMQDAGFTEATVTVMREMGSNVEKLLRDQIALNSVTKEQAENAKKLSASWKSVGEVIEKIGRDITNSPSLDLANNLERAAQSLLYIRDNWDSVGGDLWRNFKFRLGEIDSEMTGHRNSAIDRYKDWVRNFWGGSGLQRQGPVSGRVTDSSAQRPAFGGRYGAAAAGWSTAGELAEAEAQVRDLQWARKTFRRSRGAQAAAATLNGATRASAAASAASAPRTEVSIGTINLPGVTNAQEFARELPGAIRSQFAIPTQATFGAN